MCRDREKPAKDPNDMYKRVKDLVGSRACSSSGCIRAKDGTTVMEKDKILER